jgi:hypothetical protein
MEWIMCMPLKNTCTAHHFHSEAIPAAVKYRLFTLATACLSSDFITAALQTYHLI